MLARVVFLYLDFFFLWKSLVSNDCWFQSHASQHLSVHISWWAPAFRCGNCSLTSNIFRHPGPDTSYFRDWKGRGRKYWDVMVLCFKFLGLRFSSSFFSPFSANLQRAGRAYGRRIRPCLVPVLLCLLSIAHRAPSTSPPSAVQDIDISASILLCDTAPLKWETRSCTCSFIFWKDFSASVYIGWGDLLVVVEEYPKGKDASINFRTSLIPYMSGFGISKLTCSQRKQSNTIVLFFFQARGGWLFMLGVGDEEECNEIWKDL